MRILGCVNVRKRVSAVERVDPVFPMIMFVMARVIAPVEKMNVIAMHCNRIRNKRKTFKKKIK